VVWDSQYANVFYKPNPCVIQSYVGRGDGTVSMMWGPSMRCFMLEVRFDPMAVILVRFVSRWSRMMLFPIACYVEGPG